MPSVQARILLSIVVCVTYVICAVSNTQFRVQGAASPVAPGTPEGDRAADPPTEVVALASNPANLTQPPKLKFSVEFDAPGEDDTKVIVMFGGLRFKRATDRYFALLPHLDAAGGFIRHRDNHVITGDAGTMAVQDMGFMLNGDTLTYVPPAQLRYVCTGEEVPPMPVWRLLGLNDVGKPLVCRDPRGARAGGSEVVSGGADMRIVVHGRLEDAGATVRVRGSTVLRAVLEAIMARFPGLPSSQCFRRLGGSNALMFEMGKTVMELGIEDGQAFQYPAQGL